MIEIRPQVQAAIARNRAVVALESTVIAHGLPWPRSLETAHAMEETVRQEGAEPATIGILDGRAVVGLTEEEIALMAQAETVAKVSRRDLAAIVSGGGLGATTVAATIFLAHRAGIRILATGGIGGVHRGGERSLDISADLTELARTPMAVICAGAKSILDLPRTLEVLETQGVPVFGYRTDRFPAFYCRDSGLAVAHCVDSPQAAAGAITAQWDLGLDTGMVIAQPPPAADALDRSEVERFIAAATERAADAGIHGRDLTPWLLADLARASDGRTLETNISLLLANARLAGRIATAEVSLRK